MSNFDRIMVARCTHCFARQPISVHITTRIKYSELYQHHICSCSNSASTGVLLSTHAEPCHCGGRKQASHSRSSRVGQCCAVLYSTARIRSVLDQPSQLENHEEYCTGLHCYSGVVADHDLPLSRSIPLRETQIEMRGDEAMLGKLERPSPERGKYIYCESRSERRRSYIRTEVTSPRGRLDR
jgi:hypothetical protein